MRIYNRMASLIYAAHFYDKVCHDARVATKKGYPAKINGVTLTPGLPFGKVGPIEGEEDCTHFVSCCLGQTRWATNAGGTPVEIRGGGLRIASPFKNVGVYGETYVPRLVGGLISLGARMVGPQFHVTSYEATRDKILQRLGPGDVLAYASKDNPNKYEHMVLIIGGTQIACHTKSRYGEDYTDVYFPWVTLLKLPD